MSYLSQKQDINLAKNPPPSAEIIKSNKCGSVVNYDHAKYSVHGSGVNYDHAKYNVSDIVVNYDHLNSDSSVANYDHTKSKIHCSGVNYDHDKYNVRSIGVNYDHLNSESNVRSLVASYEHMHSDSSRISPSTIPRKGEILRRLPSSGISDRKFDLMTPKQNTVGQKSSRRRGSKKGVSSTQKNKISRYFDVKPGPTEIQGFEVGNQTGRPKTGQF